MKGMTRRKMLKHTGLVAGGAASVIWSTPGCHNARAEGPVQPDESCAEAQAPEAGKKLKAYPIHHAGRKRILHPNLSREILSQTAVSYLRFLGKARVSHLELPAIATPKHSGRWTPKVPTHPAHIIVSVLDRNQNRWVPVKSVDLPLNPSFAGAGLSQAMPMEEMEEFFKDAVAGQPPHRIELDEVETDCIRVECDREHPVWPNHGECNGGPFNVPFGALEELGAYGEQLEQPEAPIWQPKLRRGRFSPSAPKGMTLDTRNPLEIVFSGSRIRIGFSLIRPMLTCLEWDYFSSRRLSGNRLFFQGLKDSLGGMNGPSYLTSAGNFTAQNMTGIVEVAGHQVYYSGIQTGCGVTVDALFTVNADSIKVALEQTAERDIPAMEGEAWRLVWNMARGMTSVAGVPADHEGRNGFVELPAIIAADAGGGLSGRILEGNAAFHAESYRSLEARSTGFVLALRDTPERSLVIPQGTTRSVIELKPCALLPVSASRKTKRSDAVRKCWTAGFSAFRPEFGGWSNNAISANCHVNQHAAFDFAAFTEKPAVGPNPLDLVKFSLGRALLDGGGYGYHRHLYLDSDPILLSGAGRIVQLSRDHHWLEQVSPGIAISALRVLENFDAGEGMIICRALSGNSGSYRWSSNAMDVIGFGHIDAYVNAWSFRGLKNAASLLKILGDHALSARCAETAAAIAHNYEQRLVNPATGWVSGWRSRDGQLHDFGFVWINGVACAFGVMHPASSRRALENLEQTRREVFPEPAYLGLPLNLLPIAATDQMLRKDESLGYQLKPTFENYTDGALSPIFLAYYIRALSTHGFQQESAAIVSSLERGFADGKFAGHYGTGKEMMTWNGADSGYEGTFGPSSGALYALAVARGIITPPEPEWWL
jgi:hypothetical protein